MKVSEIRKDLESIQFDPKQRYKMEVLEKRLDNLQQALSKAFYDVTQKDCPYVQDIVQKWKGLRKNTNLNYW